MDFLDIETFLEVASSLNLTKAAERLYVSQSTITHCLQKLEKELDYALFIRRKGKRSVELTAQGEAFMPMARKWIILHQEMEQVKKNVARSLSIGTVDSAVLTVLPEVLQELSKQEHGLYVHVQTEHTPKIYAMVRNREVDVGLGTFDARLPELDTRPVFRQSYVLIKPCKNPGPWKAIHPQELDPSMEIFETWGHEYMQWHDYWWPASVPHIRVDSLMALRPFLDREDYWAIVPESSLQTVFRKYAVQSYRILEGPPPFVYYLIKQKQPGSRSLRGIQLLEQCMAQKERNLRRE